MKINELNRKGGGGHVKIKTHALHLEKVRNYMRSV